jgi:hypothetical protein
MRILFTLLFSCFSFLSFSQIDIPGCTSFGAWNYNPAANLNDGSCCFHQYVTVSPTDSVQITDGFDIITPDENGAFCADGFVFLLIDPSYTGPITVTMASGQSYTFSINDIILDEFNSVFEQSVQLILGNEILPYCGDPEACNYTPSDQQIGFSSHCDYSCVGCMDPNAFNYEPTATMDSGHCCLDLNNIIVIESSHPNTTLLITDEFEHTQELTNFTSDTLCMNGNCFSIVSIIESQDTVTYTFTNAQGVVFDTLTQTSGYLSTVISNGGIVGCTYSDAQNYNPEATCSNNQTCIFIDDDGCTDPNFFNFDPEALDDDGSCCTQEYLYYVTSNASFDAITYGEESGDSFYASANDTIEVCTMLGCLELTVYNSWPFNSVGDPFITIMDGYGNIVGQTYEYGLQLILYNNPDDANICSDPYACNYTPSATCYQISNPTCDYSCFGCTDPIASNFDPEATIDNYSCCYGLYNIVGSNNANVTVTASFSDNSSPIVLNDLANNTFCVPPGCVSLEIVSSPPSIVSLYDEGELLFSANISSTVYYISNQSVEGCTDPNACNFNPEANCNFLNECDYSCIGCMDPNAENYNPDAVIDQGTCCEMNYMRLVTTELCHAYLINNQTGDYHFLNYDNGWCAGDECFTLHLESYFWESFDYSIIDIEGNVIQSGSSNPIGFAEIELYPVDNFLCGDPFACNYSPEASECFNETFCDFSCYGCTDPEAPNYNSEALFSSNSCCYEDWFRFEFSDDVYFQIINNVSSYFDNGHYPVQEGACIPESCFHLDVWSYNNVMFDYIIYNPDNAIVAQGSSSASGQISLDIARNTGDIAGCMNPNACNYNPSATCSSGFCSGCQGCTDPNALNYADYATIEDGSCFYDIDQPLIQESVIYNGDQTEFLVQLDFMSMGNAAPFLVTTSDETQPGIIVQSVSSEYIGPFNCTENIFITIESINPFTLDFHQSLSVNGGCIISNAIENDHSQSPLNVYPNPVIGNLIYLDINEDSDSNYSIFSINGTLIQNGKVESNTIAVQNLSAGSYILKLFNEQQSYTPIHLIKLTP